MKTHDAKYTKKHDIKRNAKRVEFKLYLDDAEEAAIYKAIADAQHNYEGGAKGFIINAIRDYLKKIVL